MSRKCHECIFKGEYQDMSARTPLCDRIIDLERAVKEYNKPGPCQYHITHREIIRLQNAGVLKGEGK